MKLHISLKEKYIYKKIDTKKIMPTEAEFPTKKPETPIRSLWTRIKLYAHFGDWQSPRTKIALAV